MQQPNDWLSSAFLNPKSAEVTGLTSHAAVEKPFCLRRNDKTSGFALTWIFTECYSCSIPFSGCHRPTGTLWDGRYKSTIVAADAYVLSVYRYIELNPVRAGIVSRASDYPRSSYQGNAVGKRIELLTPHRLYRRLGKTEEERRGAYRALFRGRMSEHELTAIREATNKAWVLGSDRFNA